MLFLRNAHKVCEQEVDYIKDIVKYVINSWICNKEIKKDILGYSKLDDLILNETISSSKAKRWQLVQCHHNLHDGSSTSAIHQKAPNKPTNHPSQKAPDEI